MHGPEEMFACGVHMSARGRYFETTLCCPNGDGRETGQQVRPLGNTLRLAQATKTQLSLDAAPTRYGKRTPRLYRLAYSFPAQSGSATGLPVLNMCETQL